MKYGVLLVLPAAAALLYSFGLLVPFVRTNGKGQLGSADRLPLIDDNDKHSPLTTTSAPGTDDDDAFQAGQEDDDHGNDLALDDWERAKLDRPPKGSPVLSSSTSTSSSSEATAVSSVESTLNGWLNQVLPKGNRRACESYDLKELNQVLLRLVTQMNPALQDIYESKCHGNTGCDMRGIDNGRHKNVTAWKTSFEQERVWISKFAQHQTVRKAVIEVLRNGKCFEAVLLYYHHLSYAAREAYLHTNSSKGMGVLPLLPQNRDALHFLQAIQKERKGHSHGRRHPRQLQAEKFDPYHAHGWSVNAKEYRDFYYNATTLDMAYGLDDPTEDGAEASDTIDEVLTQYSTQSPCQMAHQAVATPWSVETAIEAGATPEQAEFLANAISEDTFNTSGVGGQVPDTELSPPSGYIPCDQAAKCLDGGTRRYMLQAVVRSYVIPGSRHIPAGSTAPFQQDLVFLTRSFEALYEDGVDTSEYGPDKTGGDGTSGLLGPALQAGPGDKIHFFVKNNIGDTTNLGPPINSAEDYWDRVQIIRTVKNDTSLSFAPNITYSGPEWPDDEYPLNVSPPVNYTDMTLGVGEQNLPGLETGGFDIFNIHLHGWEVSPHLFYPPGTSDPKADWISISPEQVNASRQCMCYQLELSEDQSRGDFIYHTHRHGTTSMLTWSGMFGLSLTGEENVTQARASPDGNATLTRDLVNIADAEGLQFDDDDVNYVVIYDSVWNYASGEASDNATEFVVSDFLDDSRSVVALHAFFVNNEFQPTINARTDALTVFRVVCVSASMICAFQILEGDGISPNSTIIPFDRVASDGISYSNPVHRMANGEPLVPDVSSSEAYLSMGGGMREVVVAQFPRPGNYTIWQRSSAFDDSFDQLLMTVVVTGEEAEVKNIEGHSLSSARPPIPESRNVTVYRGYTFWTTYAQAIYPFPWYGVGNINGGNVSAYDLEDFEIGLHGGSCGIWVIRSMDSDLHPFHIHVNPFMLLNSSAHWNDNPDLNLFLSDYTPPFDSITGTNLNGIWRDTAWVPPYGFLVIKQCYDAGVRPSLGADVETFGGKFVFHCHYLVHEDTGLIRNVILSSNKTKSNNTNTSGSCSSFTVGTWAIVAAVLTLVILVGSMSC